MDLETSVGAFGFTGGRDSLHTFVRGAFGQAPSVLEGASGNPAIFRSADLQALGAHSAMGAVPPAILFDMPLTRELCDDPPPLAAIAGLIANQIFTFNPPIHAPVRKVLVRQLGGKQARDMAPVAQATIAAILDAIAERDTIDAVADIAEPLTCRFWGAMLGMTPDECMAMEGYVRDLTPMFFLDRTPESVARLDDGVRGYRATIGTAAARALGRGEHELVNALARDLSELAFEDDLAQAGMVPGSVEALLAGNLVDGFHTAALAAVNALLVFAREPDVWTQISADRSLVAEAIGEAWRLEPPVIVLNRWTLEDVPFAGVVIPKGTIVDLMWGAGGFDPAVFPDPFAFRFGRPRGRLTTFGGGAHLCPGRNVAAMLIHALVEALLDRGWTPRLDAEPHWYERHLMSQPYTLMLGFTRA